MTMDAVPDPEAVSVFEDWDAPLAAPGDDTALYLEVDGWEGPLDLLLDLARRQKVDLRQISILQLVDQYIVYIERAEALRLELAADYLVMAAWLAYLKSALLLPREEQEDPSPEELALRLQLRLQRLGAMREAAARLMGRDRLGRDVFARGAPEGLRIDRKNAWQCEWFDLVHGLWPGAAAHPAGGPHGARAHGDDAGERAGAGFGDAGCRARLDRAARFPADGPRRRRLERSAPEALGAGIQLRRHARTGADRQGAARAGGNIRAAAREGGEGHDRVRTISNARSRPRCSLRKSR